MFFLSHEELFVFTHGDIMFYVISYIKYYANIYPPFFFILLLRLCKIHIFPTTSACRYRRTFRSWR